MSNATRKSTIFDLCPDILLEIISFLTLIDLSRLNCHLPYMKSIIRDFRLKLHGGQLNNINDFMEISSLSYYDRILSFDIPSKIINSCQINPKQFVFLRSLTVRQLDSYERLARFAKEAHIKRLVLTDFHPSRVFILREQLLRHVIMRFSCLKQLEILSKTSILSAGLDQAGLSSLRVKNLSKLVLHLPNEWQTLHKLLDHLPQLHTLVASSISCEHCQSLTSLRLPLSILGLVRVDIAFEHLVHMPVILDLIVRTPELTHFRIRLPHGIVDIDSKHLWPTVVEQCPELKHVLIGYWPLVGKHQTDSREMKNRMIQAVASLRKQFKWRHIHWKLDQSSA